MLFQNSSFEATFLKSQCFIISKILSEVFINTVSAHLGWLLYILIVSIEPTRRLLMESFAIFSKYLGHMSVNFSIAATPVIVSLSKSQNKDKDVIPIQSFHTKTCQESNKIVLDTFKKTDYYPKTNLLRTEGHGGTKILLTPLVTLSNNWGPCGRLCMKLLPTFAHVQKRWYFGFVYWLQEEWGMDNDLQKGLTVGIGRLLVQTLLDSQMVVVSNNFTKFLLKL